MFLFFLRIRYLVVCFLFLLVSAVEAELDFQTKEIDLLLLQAAFDGDVPEIKRLAAAGANLDVEVSSNLIRPIFLAAAMRRNDAVLALIELGADYQAGRAPYSVFGLAAERGQTELCRTLLARGFKLRRPDGRPV